LFATGTRVGVFTNQGCIGKGMCTADQVVSLHWEMFEPEIPRGEILHVCMCPHLSEEGCGCRKPGRLMLSRLAECWAMAPSGFVVVGDHETDLAAAATVGAIGVIVCSGRYSSPPDGRPPTGAAMVLDDVTLLPDALLAYEQTAAIP
jgi:histidinol phosphatase-like enzyme